MTNPAANRQVSKYADAESSPLATKAKARGARVATSDFQQLPTVLTSRASANVLRVGVREVRTLVDSGQLAGMRLGPRKVIRISRSALLALLRVQSAG